MFLPVSGRPGAVRCSPNAMSPVVPSPLAALHEPLTRGLELGPAQIEAAVAALADETEPDSAKAAFLRALRVKGETPAEIAGFARALLARAVDPRIDPAALPGPMLDVCGTGGDRLNLFNVSTTAGFIVAAAGVIVVKHGNRAITSRSGGADVLAALGVRLDHPPGDLRRCVEHVGMGFLFAPHYHPAFKAIAPVRRLLAAEGVSTIFNLLGPLLNPAWPAHQLVGVHSLALTRVFAEVLRQLGRRSAWAVHGAGGMDELSTLGESQVSGFEASADAIYHRVIEPEDGGLQRVESLAELQGGSAEENAATLLGILRGEIGGPRLDIVLLNAAAGLLVAGAAADLRTGVDLARAQIRDGRALAKLQALAGFL
jgi:anthranilate phosphoribosyltransferase